MMFIFFYGLAVHDVFDPNFLKSCWSILSFMCVNLFMILVAASSLNSFQYFTHNFEITVSCFLVTISFEQVSQLDVY